MELEDHLQLIKNRKVEKQSINLGDKEEEEVLLDVDLLYPRRKAQWTISLPSKLTWEELKEKALSFDYICELCQKEEALFRCIDCQETLCMTCTDNIHLMKPKHHHNIRYIQEGDPGVRKNELIEDNDEEIEFQDSRFSSTGHLFSNQRIPSRCIQLPSRELTSITNPRSLKLKQGCNVLFRNEELQRFPNQELYGVIVQSNLRVGERNRNFYRVLYVRGVSKLPNGLYQTSLTFPDAWPLPLTQYINIWHAIKALHIAEEVANKLWRREKYANRLEHVFSIQKDVEELVDTIHIAIENANLDLDEISSNKIFFEFHAKGGNLKPVIPLSTKYDDAPWKAENRMHYLLFEEQQLEFLEDARPRKMKQVILRMLYLYLGFVMDHWKKITLQERKKAIYEKRLSAGIVIQKWFKKLMRAYLIKCEKKSKRLQLQAQKSAFQRYNLSVEELDKIVFEKKEFLQKMYNRKFKSIQNILHKVMHHWYKVTNAQKMKPSNIKKDIFDNLWHPSIGMNLPILPNIFSSFMNNGGIQIENLEKLKQFKANFRGPTEVSNWLIRGRVLLGAFPSGPAFRDAKRIVARSDAISCILLQNIGTFLCLMEPKELPLCSIAHETGHPFEYQKQIQETYNILKTEFQNTEKSTLTIFNSATKALEEATFDKVEIQDKFLLKKMVAQDNYNKAKETLNNFPNMLSFISFPIPFNGVPDSMDNFLKLIQDLEKRLRDGENIYIFSKDGHGRVGILSGILLGRLYGVPPQECLFRTQRYHDTRHYSLNTNMKLTHPLISCPQSISQIQFIKQFLSKTETIYANIQRSNDQGFRLVQNQKRGILINPQQIHASIPKPNQQEIEDEKRKYEKTKRIAKRESQAFKLRKQRYQIHLENSRMQLEEFRYKESMEEYDKALENFQKLQEYPPV